LKLVCLHIGRGKTGTTAIQNFCTRNREALRLSGVYYVEAGDYGGGHQAFAKSFLGDLPDWMAPEPDIDTIHSQVNDELLNSPGDDFLISCENLTLVDPRSVKSFFTAVFDQVRFRVIFFARSQDELAESQYNQNVKWLGQALPFEAYVNTGYDELYFDELLQSWENVFGRKSLVVRVYDGAKDSIIPDFLSTLPLRAPVLPDDTEGHVSNDSVGFATLEIFKNLNTVNIADVGQRREIYRRIHETLKARDSPAIYFTSEQAREYRLRFRDSNRLFSTRYLPAVLDDLGGRRYSDAERDALLAAREAALLKAPPAPEAAAEEPMGRLPPPSDHPDAELAALRDQLHEARAAATANEAAVKALTETLREADAALSAAQAELAALRSAMPSASIAHRGRGFSLPEEARIISGKRLVALVGAQRSGTTVIGRLAGAQPAARYAGEIFHAVRGPHDDIEYRKFQYIPEVNFFSYREILFARFPSLSYPSYQNQRAIWHCYVEFLFSFSPDQIWVIDIKYNSLHHLNPIWHNAVERPSVIDLLAEMQVPILHLIRGDLFAQAVSEARSHIIGRWHSSKAEAPTGPPAAAIPLDPAELEQIMVRNAYMTSRMREILRFYPRCEELEYDEILGRGDLSMAARTRIAELFDLGPPLSGELDLRKMTPPTLNDIVPNRRGVLAYFAETPFEAAVVKHLSER